MLPCSFHPSGRLCVYLQFHERGERSVSSSTEATPPYGYQLDLDFLKYVDDIQRGNTIKRLNIQRKARPVRPAAEPVPRGGCSGGGSGYSGQGQAEWTSTGSLPSFSEEAQQSPLFYPSPQPHPPSTLIYHAHAPLPSCEPSLPPLPPEGYLSVPPEPPQRPRLPPPSPWEPPLLNPQVEKTLMETRRRLEQERHLMQPRSPSEPPGPAPRHRLASFGGMGGSSTSLFSPSTPQPLLLNGGGGSGEYNPYYTSMGSSIHHSPMSSGMTTPATNVSPLHLQHIREQMVVALRRLKELEEKVKTIPVLQVKIAVLQEEKRQMTSQKNQRLGVGSVVGGGFRKRSYSMGSADQLDPQNTLQTQELHIMEPEGQEGQEGQGHSQSTMGMEEFRRLAAEVQALGANSQEQGSHQARQTQTSFPLTHNNNNQLTSTAVGPDENMNDATVVAQRKSPVMTMVQQRRFYRDVGMATEQRETRSAGTGVTEAMLGVTSEVEAELDLQQQTIEALKEKIYRLEVDLRETTHLMEMSKLKLELQAAGGANRKRADKGFQVRPDTYSIACQARPDTQSTGSETWRVQTHSQGVGNHLETSHASTGETLHTVGVGVSCQPSLRHTASGPDLPMERWLVQERVEVQDQCVGRQLEVCDQGVGVEVGLCDQGVNTDEEVNRLELCKAQETEARERESRLVGVGECSRDVTVRQLVTMGTNPVLDATADFAVMVTPDTASQHTSTLLETVSQHTNTETVVLADGCTNTALLHTAEKHTSTLTNHTRTVAVGEGLVKDPQTVPKTRSIAVGNTAQRDGSPEEAWSAQTKEVGVGLVGIHTNFLVGLKTRNIACGPSHLDGTTVTEETVAVTTVVPPQAIPPPQQVESGAGLDHYIERLQNLLQEQQMLLTENYSELADAFGQPCSSQFTHFGSINSQLVNTLTSINSVIKYGSAEDLRTQRDGSSTATDRGQLQVSSEVIQSSEVSQTEIVSHDPRSPPSPATLKHRMDQQMSSALNGGKSSLKSIMKKKDGRQGSLGTKKNLQFVGVNGGYETTSSDESEDSSSSETEEEEEEEEEEEGEDEEEGKVFGGGEEVEERNTEEFQNAGAVEVGRSEEEGGGEKQEMRERFELSEKMLAACKVLKNHLNDGKALASKDVRACVNTVQNEWFCVSSQKTVVPGMVEDYLTAFGDISPAMLRHIVNMADGNGNTALHYSVSHSNFHIVKTLLNANVCNVNQQNKAGYTPIMLSVLAAVEAPKDMAIVEYLFSKGDVNAKASQAGQTGLMLAVSHGRMDMVRALLAQGAEVNVQDDEGSTALMCASEHGHAEIVKLLLAQPGCDATLSDSDESNALSIALEAGHKDIAVLLYAHVNFSKAQSPGTPRLSRKMSPSPTRRGMFD
ncbi:KN motif and ankyrin repeat domain-containing protein 1a isoform X3 [Salmo trutta]|uniref:KN motif and ankyrin repeat domains 1a n=1 Tax=Salmo trutta TaxID=8032 RepID=A0A673XQJ0_SALTR|nr:KN motif and ankyrin repeat domain-containing protein 1 isoform X3 [Salmo trutta]XP_029619759.1 KN motif and ankyrin repeat domain-containing protein 1 isoform X3 [Salmo trutta]XP_029619760.1 KN motif and ankyrin repeat domain-containing protein 1 isoform X3 [Salmo trutta]